MDRHLQLHPHRSITSLAPNSGAIGSVTLSRSNFGPTQGNGSVKFGTLVATSAAGVHEHCGFRFLQAL